MRKTFQVEISNAIKQDERYVLFLGDIGVYGFSEAQKTNPKQIFNIGILEQSMIGVAAGFALEGKIPIVHSIAPFLIERALEQIKIDFGYQRLAGNLISVGSSYDYAALGATHHCPGDVSELLSIPETEILIPGTKEELITMLKNHLSNEKLTYYRLSENTNDRSFDLKPGKGEKVQSGNLMTVVSIGPTLNAVKEACIDLDVEILYINSLVPFDTELISNNCKSNKILIVEPFYEYSSAPLFLQSLKRPILLDSVGVPRKFIHNYGNKSDIDNLIGMTSEKIKKKVNYLINV
jgi:transketolase